MSKNQVRLEDILTKNVEKWINLVQFTQLPQSDLLEQVPWMLPAKSKDSNKVNQILGKSILILMI